MVYWSIWVNMYLKQKYKNEYGVLPGKELVINQAVQNQTSM